MKITVKDVGAGLQVLAGHSGLRRTVKSAQLVTPDLAVLADAREWVSHVIHIRPSQIAYLSSLSGRDRVRLVGRILELKPACIVVSGGSVCRELLEGADAACIPVLKTGNLQIVNRILSEKFSSQLSIHGVLVQIFRLGALIIGKSAVGKSEVALDLLLRGHKLVADDVVLLEKMEKGLVGRPVDMGSDLLQIRGLGILNIRALYGDSAMTDASGVDLVVELEEWQRGHQYTMIGSREQRYKILGVNVPYLKLPVKPGRNMAALVEVAVRNQILKLQGFYTARDVSKRLMKRLAE
jgi:HPr kinase/phosphorylase